MKLFELYNKNPRFAWFEPTKNKAGMSGVRLAYVEATMPRFDSQIKDAVDKDDKGRLDRIRLKKHNYEVQGQKTFPKAPDLGWWLSKEEFDRGDRSQQGMTKGNIYDKYPELEIFNSRKEAEKAAKEAGVF